MRGRFSGAALAFALTVIAEIVVFVLIGNLIGFGYAVLLVLVTSALGGWLLHREGTRAWQRFREVQAAGGRPGPHVSRALVGLVAAALLILPGFITDAVGLALLVPPMRALAGRGATALATRRMSSAAVSDLFGPRRVRVRAGQPRREPDPVHVPADPASADPAQAIEGEIVEPR